FLAGEPLSLRLTLVAAAAIPPPRLSFELHDDSARVLAGGGVDTAEVGWPGGRGEGTGRFDVDALPPADGPFRLPRALAGSDERHLYPRLDDAATFIVYPGAGETGAILLEGHWSGGEVPAAAELQGS